MPISSRGSIPRKQAYFPPIYHHPLLLCVGCAHLFPSWTVTRLCSSTVAILNGSPFAGVTCGGGGGGATVVPEPVLPWIWDCAGTGTLRSAVVDASRAAELTAAAEETGSLIAAGVEMELMIAAGVEMASLTAAGVETA
jgi:hypothetical protein